MEEPIIRKSNDNKSHEEIENGVYVYYIPESAYNLYINKGTEHINRTPEQRKSAIKKIKVKRKQTRDIKEKFKKYITNKTVNILMANICFMFCSCSIKKEKIL